MQVCLGRYDSAIKIHSIFHFRIFKNIIQKELLVCCTGYIFNVTFWFDYMQCDAFHVVWTVSPIAIGLLDEHMRAC